SDINEKAQLLLGFFDRLRRTSKEVRLFHCIHFPCCILQYQCFGVHFHVDFFALSFLVSLFPENRLANRARGGYNKTSNERGGGPHGGFKYKRAVH
ncbi:hypothetical protein, partial [Oscillibacter sp.]|uniref:hypothetical protein n=1 Tax=Oscillibacter sp. TaxID=1945593 RepID=UPI00289E4CAA